MHACVCVCLYDARVCVCVCCVCVCCVCVLCVCVCCVCVCVTVCVCDFLIGGQVYTLVHITTLVHMMICHVGVVEWACTTLSSLNPTTTCVWSV